MRCASLLAQPGCGLQQPSAITQVEPHAAQIILSEAWNDIEVDAVLGQDRAMVRQADLFEPPRK